MSALKIGLLGIALASAFPAMAQEMDHSKMDHSKMTMPVPPTPTEAKPAKKKLWPGLKDLYPQQDADSIDVDELKKRFLTVIALEAARVMAEGIVTDPREADVGSILAFGFAPYTGGALSYIDFMGVKAFVDQAKALQKKYGADFKPPKLLVEMAEEGRDTSGLDAAASESQVRAALNWDETAWPWSAHGPVVMAAVRAGVPVAGANLPRARMREGASVLQRLRDAR